MKALTRPDESDLLGIQKITFDVSRTEIAILSLSTEAGDRKKKQHKGYIKFN